MKRIFALLMAIILFVLVVPTGIAENFTIRNGITFGMNVETVKKLEIEAGTSGEKLNKDNTYCKLTFDKNVKIGNIKCDDIRYEFEPSGENLFQIEYTLDDSDYLSLREALVSKYGTPEQENNVGLLTHVGAHYAYAKSVIKKDAHWCAKFDTYDVEIDLWRTAFVTVLVYSIFPSAGSSNMNSDI